ncbi:hypothetical protein FACS1894172_14560 [Spirochaetia bacterium]|nr:hypothetical protein FACS1894164_01370 [Spirochaetia bacterium]GHU34383.1 hypothetical protein FACS1894172_14560 [Spirochaetia bacterium]
MKEPKLDGVIETLKSENPVAIISNANNSDKIEELIYYLRDNNVSGLTQYITDFLNENEDDAVPVLNGIVSLYPLTIKVLANLDKIAGDSDEVESTVKKSEVIEKLILLVVRLKNKLFDARFTGIKKQIENLEEQSAENKEEISKLFKDNEVLEEKKRAVIESVKEKSKLQQDKEKSQQDLDSLEKIEECIGILNKKIADLESAWQDAEREKLALSANLEKAASELNKKDAENEKAVSELNKKNAEISKLEQDITSKDSIISGLEARFNEFTAQNERLKTELEQKTASLQDVEREKLALSANLEKAASELNKKNAENEKQSTVTPANFARIPGGTFTMGSPESEPDRNDNEVQHKVTVSSFSMSKYEVTQKEWVEVMGNNPSYFKGDSLPVENVSWYDAIEYCNARSQEEGLTPAYTINKSLKDSNNTNSSDGLKWVVTWDRNANGYRLPTEAEWEYACRAGTPTPFSTGNNITTDQANYDGRYPYNGNAKGAYRQKTIDVGNFAPNAWGLYDMSGNVWEWCWDWYGNYSSSSQADPTGAAVGSNRALRGGSWDYYAGTLRSAARSRSSATDRDDLVGFRVVRP